MTRMSIFDLAGIDPKDLKGKVAQDVSELEDKSNKIAGFGKKDQEKQHREVHEEGDNLQPLKLAPMEHSEAVRAQQKRLLSEIYELEREKRWKDIVTLCHPLAEKYPLLVEMEMDLEVQRKICFALVRIGRHDEAIKELSKMVEAATDDFITNYSLAYAAYDQLYRNKKREIILRPDEKRHLLDIAHRHFSICTKLEPDHVTPYYRRAMLFKEIEAKTRRAIPFFEKAISCWQRLSKEQQQKRHQQRPKYIKSIYHLASCFLQESLPSKALDLLKILEKEDEATGFVSPVFKQFAFGKTLYRLGRYKDALDHLRVAEAAAVDSKAPDFVMDLIAGCLLMLGKPKEALVEIEKIPAKVVKPYIRWRQADILCALDRHSEALSCLEKGLDRDSISRHKTLLRMSRICYGKGDFLLAKGYAKKASNFFHQRFGGELKEASFMEALCLYGTGQYKGALEILRGLAKAGYCCPGFRKALAAVERSYAESVGTDKGCLVQ